MSAPAGYFDYPFRRPGLDHDRFPHRALRDAPPVRWPNDARIALWITVDAEHFPMDMQAKPFLPLGGAERIAPNTWDYTMRDYGNRIGIYRIMKLLDARNLRATVSMNAQTAVRYPSLLREITGRGWEVMASGVDMKHLHHGLVPPAQEAQQISTALTTLRSMSGQAVRGWHSPAHSESAITPDLVAAQGVSYLTDWVNDDMPYVMRTDAGELVCMPLTYELSDKRVLFLQNQSVAEWERQVTDAFDCLYAEAANGGGRILSLSVAPWVIGQPYRIQALARVLDHVLAQAAVWNATGDEIVTAWEAGGGRA
jgi:peptidoglycan/xylan/chitin deacetylase (PgdA/CDA1 family)